MVKAKHCDDCKHARNVDRYDRLICAKGHKPRFYKPKSLHATIFSDSWGWKRRCDDFVLGDHVQVVQL